MTDYARQGMAVNALLLSSFQKSFQKNKKLRRGN
jgi:hypothetical protein